MRVLSLCLCTTGLAWRAGCAAQCWCRWVWAKAVPLHHTPTTFLPPAGHPPCCEAANVCGCCCWAVLYVQCIRMTLLLLFRCMAVMLCCAVLCLGQRCMC